MSDKEQKKTSSPKKKLIIGIIIGASLILAISVSAAVVVQTQAVKNYFKSADSTPPHVEESFDGTVKEDIKIRNDAEYDVYIRAKIVYTLQDVEGNVLGYVPVGKEGPSSANEDDTYDYTYVKGSVVNSTGYNEAAAGTWIYNEVDGYYYYSSPVPGKIASGDAARRQTANLMDEIKINKNSKVIKEYKDKGYSLHVEVLSQFVQVAGSVDVNDGNGKYDATKEDIPPIEDAWGAKINDKNIVASVPATPSQNP